MTLLARSGYPETVRYLSAFGVKRTSSGLKRDRRLVVISAVAENDARYVVRSGGAANGGPERWNSTHMCRCSSPLARPCGGPDGLTTGNGSAGITVAESASAAATIAADFIGDFLLHCLHRQLLANAAIAASRVAA